MEIVIILVQDAARKENPWCNMLYVANRSPNIQRVFSPSRYKEIPHNHHGWL